MTLIASIITFAKKKKIGKKMLPSTLDMVPSPSTWNPRPSTLDKKIDSRGTVTTADISMLSLERNSVLSELTFQHFKYYFKTLKFRIAENSAQINVYSTVLQFVLPRFISSKKVRSYLTLDGKTKAA